MWKLVPRGIAVEAISLGTPIFSVALRLAGIEAADEHVDKAVIVGVIIYLKYLFKPVFPPAI